jgi:hypothetical protein
MDTILNVNQSICSLLKHGFVIEQVAKQFHMSVNEFIEKAVKNMSKEHKECN